MTEISIRQATVSDWRRIAELRWQWTLERGYEPVIEWREFVDAFETWAAENAWDPDRSIRGHHCVVADRGGVVVGMAWLAVTARVPSARGVERWSGDVQCVYVTPDARGGVGRRLIDAVVDLGNELGVEHATVHSTSGALTAYRRAGFGEDGTYLVQVGAHRSHA